MKKIELILIIIVLVSLLLKILSVPGMSLFFTVSLLILYLLYFFIGFVLFNDLKLSNILKKDSYTGLSILRIMGSVGVGIALAIACVGILYKVQHWNDANLYLYLGLALICILLIITIIKFNLSKADFYKGLIIRLSVFLLMSIFVLVFKI